jgi:hypothetical protein
MRSDVIDLAGQRFERLFVIRCVGRNTKRQSVDWLCRCDCGNELTVIGRDLRSGNTKSCGCLHRHQLQTNALKHGACVSGRVTPEYRAWTHMIERCTKPNHPEWKRYGGRGVTICAEWRDDFARFRADMGPRPAKHSLDRIDPFGNYEASNCRWADARTQTQNRRCNYPERNHATPQS